MMGKERSKVAVIGLGRQSLEDHIPAIKVSKKLELTAVVEVDKKKLRSFLREHKNIEGFANIDRLFRAQKPDFIVVAVPHAAHYEVTKKALLHGIPVLKEKPFAVSLKQARELESLAAKRSVHIGIMLQRRFNPIYSTFFQFVDKIGTPFYIEARYTIFVENPHEGWRGHRKSAGGGCLIDMGYHMVDLLMWYFGLPDSLIAEMSCNAKENADYDAEDTAQVIFRYSEKDIWGSLLVSRAIFPKQEYVNVYGTQGYIHLERGKIERYSRSGELRESLSRDRGWPSAAQDQLEHFVKVIQGDKKNINGPKLHLAHLAFIEAAYKSANEHCYVNPKNFLKKHEL